MDQRHLDIQRKRLLQLVWLTILAMFALSIKLYFDNVPVDFFILLSSTIFLLIVPWLVHKGRQVLASGVFVTALTIMLLMIMWTSGGIRDNAAVAFPGILIFTALTGAHRMLLPLLLFYITNLGLMGWANDINLIQHVANEQSLTSAIDMIVIIILCGVATFTISRDNIQLLKTLQRKVDTEEQSKKEMEFIATHDPLTQLPNRLSAETQFQRLLARLNRTPGQTAALFFLDLDDFKSINDTLGHSMGDRFLVAIAERLKQTFRSDDEFFRISGDEFLVYTQNYGGPEQIVFIAEKLQKAINEPVQIDRHLLQASGSIGIVVVPRDARDYETAVKRADIAMYRAKGSGKNCFHFYDADIEQDLLKRYDLETGITQGLVQEEFYVCFQPIVNLENGDYVGAEALIRWQHPVYGFVPPDTFIPLAENNHQIDLIYQFVVQEAQTLLSQLTESHPDFYVSVNLSPSQLKTADVDERILSHISLPFQSRLKMEMTESQIIENIEIYEQNIQSMKQRGIGIFLDDFGTGYSNLGYLQRLQFETVKIDKSFTSNIHVEAEKQPVIRAISNMAREIGMTVVAEGVENEAELVALRNLKIAYGQGYYWSKPVQMKEFLKKLSY